MSPNALLHIASSTVESIAPALANHLWQSTVFAAVAGLLTLALRRNHARIRYALWLAASLKFLIPFSLLVALGSHLHRPHPATPQQAAVYVAMEEVSQPFADQPTLISTNPAPKTPTLTPIEALELSLAALWLSGSVIFLLRWLLRWRQMSLVMRQAIPTSQGREFELLRQLAETLALNTRIHLLLSPSPLGPGVYGIARPKLIWPSGISLRLDDAHLKTVMAHELCHVRRRDNLTAALHMLVETIFWFHPMVWWLGARLIDERERACDESVMELTNQPHIYAESILKICEFYVEPPLACVSGVTGADLKKRLIDILDRRAILKLSRAKIALLTAAGLATLALPILSGQATAARHMMLATIAPLPMPIRALASGMIPAAETPAIGEPAAAQLAPATGGTADSPDPCDVSTGARFDVVSIRPSKSGIGDWDEEGTADEISMSGSVVHLIEEAYKLREFQITGGPDWLVSQTFDIKAKFDDPNHATDAAGRQVEALKGVQRIQGLLAERFQFKCHMTTRQLPVFDLVIAKGGAKLSHATSEESKGTSISSHSVAHGGIRATGTGVTTQALATMLARSMGRTVVDKTGLTGSYDFSLAWKRDSSSAAQDTESGAPEPELPVALEEQLGLKLVPAKGPVPVLVVDHADKPSFDGAELSAPTPRLLPAALVQEKPGAQTPATANRPSFEVASIRPNDPAKNPVLAYTRPSPTRPVYIGSLQYFIKLAYGVDDVQISGGPKWMDSDLYEINAKTPAPATPGELNQMLQTLLAERFNLALHESTKELPAYSLTVARNGPKLPPSNDHIATGSGPTLLRGTMDTPTIAKLLTSMLGRTVVNNTGLTGVYKVDLTWDPSATTVFTAIQEQLGLRLDANKAPVRVLVVDNANKPSPN